VQGGLDEDVVIENLVRLSGGASRETWAFDAVTASERHRLILRRDPPVDPRPDGMRLEALALQHAADAGVTVPAVLTWDADASVLGAPFIVMARIDGETIPRKLLRDPEFEKARGAYAHDVGVLLGRIHGIEASGLEGIEELDPVDHYREVLHSIKLPHPALELGLRWLEENRPDRVRTTVVHGDYRNGNFIVGPEGIRAVLDWELVHQGDPVEDLGYMCIRAWRFGETLPVGGFGTLEELCHGYEEGGGDRIDPAVLHWWIVAGTFKWGVACLEHAEAHLSGTARSIEKAVIGRRVAETEYDLLGLLR
jgi:aminoglycoside phosphotransferase (APT) family kinase protein